MKKKVLFVTGTRADFGKLKSLIEVTDKADEFEVQLFITGMHMMSRYGMTSIEVERLKIASSYKYINQTKNDTMDVVLAKTITGLSDYIHENNPDVIVVHGDRVEAMAGAIVGSLNNILVAHIEGGEVSGTIDELIRHSISKMAHTHFVSNSEAQERLVQLGEAKSSIFTIGSPDLDVMNSPNLPSLETVKEKYDIAFKDYSVFMYHPVTTELESLESNIKSTVDAMLESDENFVVVYPNNDHGTDTILAELKRCENHPRFRIYPSIRFEYFLVLLKNANMIIGNSSAGVREAPFYGIPTINLGSRQQSRATAESILNVEEQTPAILEAIKTFKTKRFEPSSEFGDGNSAEGFISTLRSEAFWAISKQKVFVDWDKREKS
ncbi:UDP-N-acetylglucosamine 2-epimerase [Idiomarina loihiensis]|uniref:UDP-N-acetylglucosamine 2-epimerase n=1 Tax=Idiomarina loihiensis (strain ATCC BAA-735 / DSM 15497 / L2-TR) TaxID=283942 RepID=Q5R081_IDILO|nr:UDP-N-acetylglucosamine 2-epimerase [Idiomarina loihiensis]AAV81363.1 UDP-N-acetylglucosamine 2-epimerase [Idiomarina loihiensis L2TR]AGM35388.1 UDP-N-acetylglucosamine 2-epimerase [Idiomarina loihiensis GSL 199]